MITTSEDEVAEEMDKVANEADEDLSQGEDNAGDDSEVEMEVSGVSCKMQGQWSNTMLAERIAWRQGNTLWDLWDLMQWQVEETERQEEILWDQA